MMKTDRYSLWPDVELPLPALKAYPAATADPDGWIHPAQPHEFGGVASLQFVDCPAEMHLREFGAVDVRKVDDLVGLVRLTGHPLHDLHAPYIGVLSSNVMPHIGQSIYEADMAQLASDLGHTAPDLANRPPDAVHAVEVAHRVLVVQLLVEHLHAAFDNRRVEKVWQEAELLEFSKATYTTHIGLDEATAEQAAWSRFSDLLNRGLGSVSPRVSVSLPGDPSRDDVSDSFTAACTLMFNDLSQGMPYKRCHDETCRRLFKKQLGRSTGQHSRTDALYCTPLHARNQAQRVKRRDKRAEQRRSDHGQ